MSRGFINSHSKIPFFTTRSAIHHCSIAGHLCFLGANDAARGAPECATCGVCRPHRFFRGTILGNPFFSLAFRRGGDAAAGGGELHPPHSLPCQRPVVIAPLSAPPARKTRRRARHPRSHSLSLGYKKTETPQCLDGRNSLFATVRIFGVVYFDSQIMQAHFFLSLIPPLLPAWDRKMRCGHCLTRSSLATAYIWQKAIPFWSIQVRAWKETPS